MHKFRQRGERSIVECNKRLENALVSDENYIICEAEFTIDNLLVALKSIPNTKTPGNDGLSKEFLKLFLGRCKRCFHKFIETSENRRQPMYITKTSCYENFQKK